MRKNPDIPVGDRFGKLVVIRKLPDKLYNEDGYACQCDCGEPTKATRSHLVSGRKKSCGCLRRKSPVNTIDLTGQRFGKLVALERAGKTKRDNALWLCQCDCGETTKAMSTSLRRGDTVSCGCDKPNQMSKARNVLMTEKSVDGVQVPLLQKKVRSDSKTGFKGVCKRIRKGNEYYIAHISVKGKRYYAKEEKTVEAAIAARKRLEEKYHAPYIEALEDETNDQ